MDLKLDLERGILGDESVEDLVSQAEFFRERVRTTTPEVTTKYALLRDKEFLDAFPGIVRLASYFYCRPWHGNASVSRRILSVDTLEEWLNLLSQSDETAREQYNFYSGTF